MKLKRIITCSLLSLALVIAGCSYQSAVTTFNVVNGIIAVANAELPTLASTIPANELSLIQGYVNLASNLNGQYKSCIDNAQNSMLNTKGKFLSCLNTFATGLSDPKELSLLRIMSAKSQSKVQLYIVALVTGVNATIIAFGGSTNPPPVVGAAPTSAELTNFKSQVASHISYRDRLVSGL